jgi:hypothetical protein
MVPCSSAVTCVKQKGPSIGVTCAELGKRAEVPEMNVNGARAEARKPNLETRYHAYKGARFSPPLGE